SDVRSNRRHGLQPKQSGRMQRPARHAEANDNRQDEMEKSSLDQSLQIGISRYWHFLLQDHALAMRAGSRAARQISHCRRHGGMSTGENASRRSKRRSNGPTGATGRNAGSASAGSSSSRRLAVAK